MSKNKNNRKESAWDRAQFESIKKLLNSNKRSKGLSELIKYLERYPEDAYAHYLYGRYLFNLGSLDDAESEFQKAAMFPAKNYNAVLVALAQIALAKEDKDTAREYFEKAIKINPFNSLIPYIGLAQLEREDNNLYTSLNILYSALDIEPAPSQISTSCTKNTVLLEIAKTLIRLGKIDEAKEILPKILPVNNLEMRNLNYSKGIIYENLGEISKSKECYALVIDNSVNDKLSHEAKVKISYIAINEGNPEIVINLFEDRLDDMEIYGGDGIVPFGRAYLQVKRYAEAIKIFKLGMSSDKYRNICTYYYVALKIQEGSVEEAKRALEQALSKRTSFDIGISTELLRILYDEKNYQDMSEHIKKTRQYELNEAEDKIIKKFEREILQESDCEQINSTVYDEEVAINSIDSNSRELERGVRFASDVDIRELFFDVKSSLIEDNMLPKTTYYDFYQIVKPYIGYEMDEPLDILIVRTLPNTKNIIDMYPARKSELPTKAEFLSSLEKETVKVNKQISKFNDRFNKFQNKKNN